MPVIQVGRRVLAVKYTASPSNAAEVLSMFADHAVVDGCTISNGGESGGILTINHAYPGQSAVPYKQAFDGKWIVHDVSIDSTLAGLPDSEFGALFRTFPQVASSLAAEQNMKDAIALAIAQSAGAFGVAAVPALAVGTQNIAVTVKPTLPSLSYTATAFVTGSSLLANVTAGTPVKTSTSIVTVPVTNSGLVTLNNLNVIVHCTV